MKIVISGASGFVGGRLTSFFSKLGYLVVPILRSDLERNNFDELVRKISGAECVINLAGETIAQFWTENAQHRIYLSRVDTTRRVVSAINAAHNRPKLFISASATGYYNPNTPCNELICKKGNGFLADVCQQWEAEAANVSNDVRLVISRFGVVLDSHKGALPKILAPFRFGVGVVAGSGRQHFSWIHIDDLCGAMHFLISNAQLKGPYNFTTSDIVSYRELIDKIAEIKGVKKVIYLPSILLYARFGAGAATILDGWIVSPKRLKDAGFRWKYPTLTKALKNILQ